MKNPDDDHVTMLVPVRFTIEELADVIVDQLDNDQIIELFREVDNRVAEYSFTMEIINLSQQLKRELGGEQ